MSSARPKTRVLFVCSHNRVRSPTAEQVYRGRADLEVRSAGIAEYAAVPLTDELVEWADLVFVFSKRQQRIIEARFRDGSDGKRLVCVTVPDRFEYKSPKLISKLTGKLLPYLGPPAYSELTSTPNPPAQPGAGNRNLSQTATAPSAVRSLLALFNNVFSGARALLAQPSAQ